MTSAIESRRSERSAIHVVQGEYAVSSDPAVVLCTLLGSCVAACIRDPEAGVGGLNHFLLPEGTGGSSSLSYGVNAMELLINDLLRRGARRDRLEAKLFGGARMLNNMSDIGAQNARFGREFCEKEGIPITGGSLGGAQARRIEFWPASGRVRQQQIGIDRGLAERELARRTEPVQPPADSVELF